MRAPCFLTAAWVACSSASFVTPPTDLHTATGNVGIQVRYKQVPDGTCELTPGVKSYSGYADVDTDQHIFFWFFEAREVDPTEAPLTVYYEGGPGDSSMIGLFQSLGPCGVDMNQTVYNNPFAFNRKTNLLFVDQPVGTGFSYTKLMYGCLDDCDDPVGSVSEIPTAEYPDDKPESCCGTFSSTRDDDLLLITNSTVSAAPNMWKALQGFMGVFPQYSRRGIHIITESYGGHYGPVFSDYFLEQNAQNISGAADICLESMYINNGWFDPKIGFETYYHFTQNNTYDFLPYNQSLSRQIKDNLYGPTKCLAQLDQCYQTNDDDDCSSADTFCLRYIQAPFHDVAHRQADDLRYQDTDDDPAPFPYDFYPDHLNSRETRAAIGAVVTFQEESAAVVEAFGNTGDDSKDLGLIPTLRKLVERGIRVNLLAGDADFTCAWTGVQEVASRVGAPGYAGAGFAPLQTSDQATHGEVRQAGGFAFVRMYQAGHIIPFYQPLAMLELFERQLAGTDLATGRVGLTDAYQTTGLLESTFREGLRTVQTGRVPLCATYNTTTALPNPCAPGSGGGGGDGDD